MKLQARNAIAQIHQARAGVVAHDPVRFVEARKTDGLRRLNFRGITALGEVEEGASSIALLVERRLAAREQIADHRRHFPSLLGQPIRRLADPKGIPDFKWAKLPVIAPLHCVIHCDHVVGDFREPIRRVADHRTQVLPGKHACPIRCRAQHPKAFRRITRLAGRFERSQLRLLLRTIRDPVQEIHPVKAPGVLSETIQ